VIFLAESHSVGDGHSTMRDLHQEGAALDYPVGGSGAVVDALVRAATKNNNGRVFLNTHVDKIILRDGRACGVRLRKGKKVVYAKRAVISNASVWDTMKLLREGREEDGHGWDDNESTPVRNSELVLFRMIIIS